MLNEYGFLYIQIHACYGIAKFKLNIDNTTWSNSEKNHYTFYKVIYSTSMYFTGLATHLNQHEPELAGASRRIYPSKKPHVGIISCGNWSQQTNYGIFSFRNINRNCKTINASCRFIDIFYRIFYKFNGIFLFRNRPKTVKRSTFILAS